MKQSLLYKINSGQFLPGDKFYSEAELKKEYNVSGITVIKAIQELKQEGYLVRYQGKGTYVSKGKKAKVVRFSDQEKYQGMQESTRVLTVERMTDPSIAKELNISEEEPFYLIKRVRMIDNIPLLVQYSYVLAEFIREEDVENLEAFSSIYEKIKEDFQINLFQADSTEVTEICFPIPSGESDLLEIKKDEPTAFIRRHTYLPGNRVVEYIETYKRWEYFSNKIEPL
ncbi:GntR family transcriptional regulator [Gracilibacillus timonensis]|uniref:GntR family transcriptional regulator n=1 Tax=Gracilibacillus timonensis TaxID=1816696 RepID=UPI0021CC0544|nr:GntR family transcriptional regulator [Gracilibacillus timonensis]